MHKIARCLFHVRLPAACGQWVKNTRSFRLPVPDNRAKRPSCANFFRTTGTYPWKIRTYKTLHIPGQFILAGSQNYLLMERITQSLAGRVALFKLFPFSFGELRSAGLKPTTPEQAMYQGFYPRVFDQKLDPRDFYPNYFETYVQRDVRQLTAVHDLVQFRNFVRLCAGRIGQPLNYQSLAADSGISSVTAKAWVGILEASHIVFLLPPYFRNFSKRISKTPKLYFYDVGFAANLLGIAGPEDLTAHFARGNLFENMIVAEITKQQFQAGWASDL